MPEPGTACSAIPHTMSTSLRSDGDAGSFPPRVAWTTLIESSTVTHRFPSPPPSGRSSSVRPRHGRISAVAPQRTCERLSFVDTWTVSRHRSIAAAVTSLSGVAATKLPPIPTNTSTSPRRIASIAATVS